MTPPRFDVMDKVGITGSSWLGPFLVKRRVPWSLDVNCYDLSPVKAEAEPLWEVSETALYCWPDVGGRPSWDKEAL
jgi:hypothetical protein